MLKLLFKTTLLLIAYQILFPSAFSAQVIPDQTLGTESSTIRSIDNLRDVIEGGAIRGENLFHSFQKFNVSERASVNFANPNGIANIFSRVTGGSISEILGTLGADGAANLFLMNPNGIVFGKNSVVNVNGSFLTTTSETIRFNDGSEFSSVEPGEPLLTIGFPIGLSFGSDTGDIKLEGNGHTLAASSSGSLIRVPIPQTIDQRFSIKSKKNIAIIGGNISLNGAILGTDNGNIEIAGVKKGFVTFEPDTWKFDYNQVQEFGNVALNLQTLIDSNGNSGDSIGITADTLSLKDGSLVLVQSQNSTVPTGINIDSSNLEIIGGVILNIRENGSVDFTPSAIVSELIGEGKATDIKITTEKLLLDAGGQIGSATFTDQSGGNISVEALDSVQVSGFFEPLNVASNLGSVTNNLGDAGEINLSSQKLLLNSGGTISSVTSGAGNAGNLDLNIAESVEISGFVPDLLTPTSVISISFNTGDTGNIDLNTANLNIADGGSVISFAASSGNAGEVKVNASEEIQIEDRLFFGEAVLISSISSSAEAITNTQTSVFQVPPVLSANAGNITINTPKLKIFDGGIIAVRNTGTGNAGNLQINTDQITLEDRGNISASTVSGEGGNITLNADNLELLNQSQITSSAGGSGNGGNITIDSDSILGINNSDITANAIGGNGGNINITSDAILGLQERSQLTPFNDITATSEFGINGTITINAPDIDFENEVFAALIPQTAMPTLKTLQRKCLNPKKKEGKLLYIGRGGVPENPRNFFDDEEIVAIDEVSSGDRQESEIDPEVWIEGDPIIEANSVLTAANGDVYLVAETRLEDIDLGICRAEKEEK